MHFYTYFALVALATAFCFVQVSSTEANEEENEDGGFAQTRCLLAAIVAAKVASKFIGGGVQDEEIIIEYPVYVDAPYYVDTPVYVDTPIYIDQGYQFVNEDYYLQQPGFNWETSYQEVYQPGYEYIEAPVNFGDDGWWYAFNPVQERNYRLNRKYDPFIYKKLDKETGKPVSDTTFVRMRKAEFDNEEAPRAVILPAHQVQRPRTVQQEVSRPQPTQERESTRVVYQEVRRPQQEPTRQVRPAPVLVQRTVQRTPAQQQQVAKKIVIRRN